MRPITYVEMGTLVWLTEKVAKTSTLRNRRNPRNPRFVDLGCFYGKNSRVSVAVALNFEYPYLPSATRLIYPYLPY